MAKFCQNPLEANTGAACSGFFAFPKLYHLLQLNTGAALGLVGAVFPSVCLAENLPETVPALPPGLGFGVLLVASLLLASLWENPSDGRSPRQRRTGIFHRLLAAAWRSVVLAAAWWYEHVVNFIAASSFDLFYVPIRKRYGHERAWRIATFIEQRALPLLLGGWLVWPIAEVHLRDKWQAELDEQNRQYRASVGGKE